MKSYLKGFLPFLLVTIIILSLFSGCGAAADGTGADKESETSATAAPDTGTTAKATEQAPIYPMPPVTLTQLAYVNPPDIDSLINGDMANALWNIELAKRTGVTVEYTMVTMEDYDTKMNLLISSNDIPDLVQLPSNYSGGTSRAFKDGLIADISQHWKEAPNLKKVLDSNSDWMKQIKDDDGRVLAFPVIRESKDITVFFGPMLRKDLLDKLKLAVPETMDEWYNVLTAFKKDGIKSPFTALYWFPGYDGSFVGAYQANSPGTQAIYAGLDGKMVFGPMQPGYRDYLATMNKWYKEGLMDPDFITLNDWGVLDTKMTSGQSAATLHFLSKINAYTTAGKASDPKFEMVAAPHPVLVKGDTPYLCQASTSCSEYTSVNAKSKKLLEAIKFLDYGYSPEGQEFYCFGVKDESYTLDASGQPVYTDMIMSDPNSRGWTKVQSMGMYLPITNDAPSVQLTSHFFQLRVTNDASKNAIGQWKNASLSTFYSLSPFTEAETETVKKLTDLDTYVTEMTAKFIMGTEPIDNFDKYLEKIKQLNVDEILAAYQAARDRYNNR